MIALLHAAAWGVLLIAVVPYRFQVGSMVFGLGLGVTAYVLGVRHAFDVDHIAAIDNTTRKLMVEGRRPVSAGFWLALGRSAVVVVLAVLIATGARAATGALLDDSSRVHQTLGVVGTSVSGLFLYLIGVLTLVALAGVVRLFRRLRRGEVDPAGLDTSIAARGMLSRVVRRLTGTA
ncbi:hypothetical protein [Dactylosporangium sp. CA-139066]|uniref:HoxN/HupN/NixA family nickel/cobalt transporter n=1 Tax=Dactylosporangium sp. CA-139066 TaxID=3239930 RepID=UPI003D9155BF